MPVKILGVFILMSILMISCSSNESTNNKKIPNADTGKLAADTNNKNQIAGPEIIVAKKEVPILCYHRIRNFLPRESERMKGYVVTPSAFADQMKSLADSGFQTISSDQLHDYLAYGASIPPKPILISFDDTSEEHFTIAAAEMKKYNFKGLYFIMTISINRPRYMTKAQIKQLADEGHEIAVHTWDHHKVTDYTTQADWDVQLLNPKKQLEEITGKPVNYFAYPFGIFSKDAFPELKKRGFKAAFQLSFKRDSLEPLYNIRRMVVPGTWSTQKMFRWMNNTFR